MRSALVLLLLAACSACAGQHPPTPAGTDPAGIPAPQALLRRAAFIPGARSLHGAQFEAGLPSGHVSSAGDALLLSPAAAAQDLADSAYAIYALDLSAYSGESLLGLSWAGAAPSAQAWVGLADWNADRWHWLPLPAGSESDIGDYTPYVNSLDGRMLLALVYSGAAPAQLDQVYFGTPGLEPPLNLSASDSDFSDHIALSWDTPAGGITPEAYSVWRSDDQGGPYAQLDSVASPGYDDFAIAPNTSYWYRVRSTKSGESDSQYSNEDSGTAGLAPGWHVSIAGPVAQSQDPIYVSLAEVNGNPAIVYNRNAAGYGIHYVRALDSFGQSWDGIQDLLASGQEPSLAFISGVPTVAYSDSSGSNNIYYLQGQDADGSGWGAPVTVDDLAGANLLSDPDQLEVAGRPAIAFKNADFQNFSGTQLCFIRASDASGDNWPANRVVVDTGQVASNPKLVMLITGKPAIVYAQNDKFNADPAKVLFVRGTDANGSAWQAPEDVYTFASPNTLAQLQVVIADGNPAVFIFEPGGAGPNTLYYKRATDTTGNNWPASATTLKTGVGFLDGAITVDTRPAAAYLANSGTELRYLEAVDSAGNSWLPDVLVDSDARGLVAATLESLGASPEHPCIAYCLKRQNPDDGEIRFARRN